MFGYNCERNSGIFLQLNSVMRHSDDEKYGWYVSFVSCAVIIIVFVAHLSTVSCPFGLCAEQHCRDYNQGELTRPPPQVNTCETTEETSTCDGRRMTEYGRFFRDSGKMPAVRPATPGRVGGRKLPPSTLVDT